MSSISSKSMHHARPAPGAFDPETGKIAPPSPKPKAPEPRKSGWLLGLVGAGVALATVAAVVSLRGSTPKKRSRAVPKRTTPAKPRRRPAKKAAQGD